MGTTTKPPKPPKRAVHMLATAFAGAALSGCVSLDHTGDIDAAAELIAQRSGEEPQWDLPWDQPHDIWDGRSALAADDAVRIALVNNRSIRASLQRIAAARADLVQAGLLPNPVVSVGLGFPIDGSGGSTSVGAGLMQSIIALWLRGDRMSAAEHALQREILTVSDETLQLVRNVRRQHAEIAFAHHELSLLNEQHELLQQLVSLVQRRREAGEASTLDVSRVELQQYAIDAAILQKQQDVTQHKLAMLELLGWSEAAIEWTVNPQPPEAMDAGVNERMLIQAIDTQRLDVLAARAHVQSRREQLRLEGRQRLVPGAEAGIDFMREGDGRKELGPMVALEIPLFDTNHAATARAAAAYREAAINADRIRQQAIAEARIIHADIAQLREQIHLYETDVLPAASEILELAQRSIDAGIVDATVLIEAQREHIDARLTLTELQQQLHLRLIDLERAVGGPLNSQPPSNDTQASSPPDPKPSP